MRVYRSVTGCTSQSLVLFVWNVVESLTISVFLGKTKIDQIDNVRLSIEADKEVVWLNISMDVVSRMAKLNSRDLDVNLNSTIWSASMRTVFSENLFSQIWNRSSRLGPSMSITIITD